MHPLSLLAQDDSASGGGAIQLVILLLIPVAMYFLLIRPQRRRMKEQAAMQSAIEQGDEVVTSSGIYGFISAVEDDYFWLEIDDDVLAATEQLSGEGRFRWLHAAPGRHDELLAAAEACHGRIAWVRSIERMLDENWFGPSMNEDIRGRLGDVALLPFEHHAFADPADGGPFELIGRHGSLTSAEMLVPCLVATA